MTHERCYTGGCREAQLSYNGVPFACDLPEEIEEAAGNATASDWRGYPREVLKHPMRNHPRFVSWLIAHYSSPYDIVYDPMAGAGTMIREAEKLNRFGCGWDVVDEYQALWPEGRIRLPTNQHLVDMVITSPDYWGNHAPGNTQRQRDLTTKAGSSAGSELILVPGSIGGKHDWSTYVLLLRNVLLQAMKVLRPGGHFVTIARNRIRYGQETSYVQVLTLVLAGLDLEPLAAHWRRLEPTHQYRKRERLALEKGQPKPPYVDREYAMVWRRPA